MLSLIDLAVISVLVSSACLISTTKAQSCQNGGTYDTVRYTCLCTPQAYGESCERRFSDLSPCRNATGAGVATISDAMSVHAARQLEACGTSSRPCTNFAAIAPGWYLFDSPSGNYLVEDFPCEAGVAIGCGSGGGSLPYTLRHKVLDGEPENGSKLYSARAYPYLPDSPQCYNSHDIFYLVRLLVCPNKTVLYYLGPTLSQSHLYCIGVNGSTTTTTTTTTTTATTTTTTTTSGLTVAPSTTTPGTVQSTPTAGTVQSTPTDSSTQSKASTKGPTAAVVTTPGSSGGRPEWNNLVNDENPLFRINTTGIANLSAISCQIRSNSLQVDYQRLSQAITDSTGVFCDFRPTVQWLAESKRLYINCLLEVFNNMGQKMSSTDITVCQSRFHGKPVRHLVNRGQCVVEEDVENFRPTFWRQWFGDL